jgi:hypothetical protein
MVCVRVPLLLKRKSGVLFGVLRGARSDVLFFLSLLCLCIVVMSSHFLFLQLTDTCKGNKYRQI